jgi:hypothetical protein
MVGHRGIEANPAKVDVLRKMAKPSNKKVVMKLTGMMAALGRFISKLGEKGIPFFKLLKKADKFVWDDEAQKAFEALNESLTTPPVITPPISKETLLLYISATTNVVSTVLLAEREEEGQAYPVQRRLYYVSEVLADAKTRYTQPQKLLYALLIMSRKPSPSRNCAHTRLGPGHLHTRLKYTIGRVVLVLVSPLLRHSLCTLPLEAKLTLVTISPTIVTMKPHRLRFRLGLGLLTWFLSTWLLNRFLLTRLLSFFPRTHSPMCSRT